MHPRSSALYCILLVCCFVDGQIRPAPVTSTTTITSWKWVTLTTSTNTDDVCAKLINVTQPCRRRRGKWVEEPVILTFDEDMDKIDALLIPSETQRYSNYFTIKSSIRLRHSFRVESTDALIVQRNRRSEVESSVGRVDSSNGRIFLNQLTAILNQLRRTVMVTITDTSTRTVTSLISVHSTTKTFFIQSCTPSPFPYNIC